MNNNKQKMT